MLDPSAAIDFEQPAVEAETHISRLIEIVASLKADVATIRELASPTARRPWLHDIAAPHDDPGPISTLTEMMVQLREDVAGLRALIVPSRHQPWLHAGSPSFKPQRRSARDRG